MTTAAFHAQTEAPGTSDRTPHIPAVADLEADPRYARGIPLRAKSGTIRAFAMVDAIDYASVSRSRWCLVANGYVGRRPSKGAKTILLHRHLLGLVPGDGRLGDHRNGDTLDHRRSNLRIASALSNAHNRRTRTGASRFRGVSWEHRYGGYWIAYATLEGRRRYLGGFASELDAAIAAETFRRENMPFAQPDPELARALAAARLTAEAQA